MEYRPINLTRLKTLALALLATVWLGSCDDDDENNTTPRAKCGRNLPERSPN